MPLLLREFSQESAAVPANNMVLTVSDRQGIRNSWFKDATSVLWGDVLIGWVGVVRWCGAKGTSPTKNDRRDRAC